MNKWVVGGLASAVIAAGALFIDDVPADAGPTYTETVRCGVHVPAGAPGRHVPAEAFGGVISRDIGVIEDYQQIVFLKWAAYDSFHQWVVIEFRDSSQRPLGRIGPYFIGSDGEAIGSYVLADHFRVSFRTSAAGPEVEAGWCGHGV